MSIFDVSQDNGPTNGIGRSNNFVNKCDNWVTRESRARSAALFNTMRQFALRELHSYLEASPFDFKTNKVAEPKAVRLRTGTRTPTKAWKQDKPAAAGCLGRFLAGETPFSW